MCITKTTDLEVFQIQPETQDFFSTTYYYSFHLWTFMSLLIPFDNALLLVEVFLANTWCYTNFNVCRLATYMFSENCSVALECHLYIINSFKNTSIYTSNITQSAEQWYPICYSERIKNMGFGILKQRTI